MTDLTQERYRTGRTLGRTVYARTGGDDYRADAAIGLLDTPAIAARACADHNAVLDLEWLLGAGWLAQLGEARAPGGTPAGCYASVRRTGGIASVNSTGETAGEALAKAREWAEGKGAAS